ncbi:MAG: restriction endonuclease subunit S [Burkholderiaceae bacterium]|nr:restriction endonuclease subunit S [Burkholderiaceae bacterium]
MGNTIKTRKSFSGHARKLQDLCISITDCHHSTPVWRDWGKIVVRNFNIKNGKLDLSSPSYTDEATFNERISRAKPEPGDLIITREAPMGEVCIIPKGVECCLGQRMVLIKPNPGKVNSQYLLYAMLSGFVQGQINQSDKTGSIVSNLRIPLLKELEIPLIEGADKIAAVLSALDAKIDCNNRINAELEAMAKTLYDYWFVQFDFPAAYGKPYKSSGGKMVFNATLKRLIPEGWEDGTLDDLGQIVGGSTPSTERLSNFTLKGTPWITPYDLSGNQGNKFITRGTQDVSDEGIKDASLKKLPAGTVLLSSRAPIGYMAIARTELTTNQGFKSFIPVNGFSTAFIYYTVKGQLKTITQYASGSTFKEVSAGVLKTVKIVLPKSSVVAQFTESVESIFKRQDVLEQENQQLAQLRDWLLPLLMNGQVTVA